MCGKPIVYLFILRRLHSKPCYQYASDKSGYSAADTPRPNNWVKSDKKKALNSDLWEKLLDLLEVHKVNFNWVKGHAGHPENERCDELAVMGSKKFSRS